MKAISVFELRDQFKNKPLAIYGAGPGFSLLPYTSLDAHVFALNCTIAKLWQMKRVFWVSNDHNVTWNHRTIRKKLLPAIKDYSKWKTITQKIFVPGKVGDLNWVDCKGKKHAPMTFRLPGDRISTIYYYNSGKGNEPLGDYIEAGETVLELALEVATLWGFSPIVLIGCDLHLDNEKNYYSKQFRWKQTPARMLRGKIEKARKSVIARRKHWAKNIYMLSDLWQDSPFINVNVKEASKLLWKQH